MFVFIRQDSAAGFFRFCSSFSCLPAAAVLFRPVFLPPRPFCPKNIRLDVACVSYRKKGDFWKFPVFHAGNTPIHAETSCVLPPPRAILSLASNLCFLVPPIHVVIQVGRDGGAPPCPVPIIIVEICNRRYSQWSLIADSPCASWGMFRCFSARKRHLPLPALRHNGSRPSLSPVP